MPSDCSHCKTHWAVYAVVCHGPENEWEANARCVVWKCASPVLILITSLLNAPLDVCIIIEKFSSVKDCRWMKNG